MNVVQVFLERWASVVDKWSITLNKCFRWVHKFWLTVQCLYSFLYRLKDVTLSYRLTKKKSSGAFSIMWLIPPTTFPVFSRSIMYRTKKIYQYFLFVYHSIMIWYGMTIWYDVWERHDITWYYMALHDITWHSMSWHEIPLDDMTWHDMTFHGMTIYNIL